MEVWKQIVCHMEASRGRTSYRPSMTTVVVLYVQGDAGAKKMMIQQSAELMLGVTAPT